MTNLQDCSLFKTGAIMLVVLVGGGVINISENEMRMTAHLMAKPIECLYSLMKAEGKPQELKQPKWSGHCKLQNIFGFDRNLLISLRSILLE